VRRSICINRAQGHIASCSLCDLRASAVNPPGGPVQKLKAQSRQPRQGGGGWGGEENLRHGLPEKTVLPPYGPITTGTISEAPLASACAGVQRAYVSTRRTVVAPA